MLYNTQPKQKVTDLCKRKLEKIAKMLHLMLLNVASDIFSEMILKNR